MHAVTYFAPESSAALGALGFRGFWIGYFAARSAPLGVVPTEVVSAMFYNFSFDRVAKALPAAWEFASPADALRVREESAVAALRRYGVTDDHGVRTAAELTAKGARSASLDGRALSRRIWRSGGRTNRWPNAGVRSRCRANSAVTGTWPCWRPGGNARGP